MKARHLLALRGAWALCWGTAVPTAGQDVWSAAVLETYTFSDPEVWNVDRVQLFTAPFGVAWSGGPFALDLRGAYARGIAAFSSGGTTEVSGLTDARASAALSTGPFTFSGFGILPTGEATHSADQVAVLGIAASELLPLAVTAWGTGGGVGGEMAVRGRLRSTRLGLSGSYYQPEAFRPWPDNTPFYRPGAHLRLGTWAEWPLGVSGVLSVAVGHRRFLDDTYDELNLMQAGERTEGSVSFTTALGARESMAVYARYGMRWAGVLRGQTEYLTSRQFPGIVEPTGRSLIVTGVELRAQRSRSTVLPSAELRILGTEGGLGSGWTAAVGVDLDHHPAWLGRYRRWAVSPRARVLLGSVEGAASARVGFVGWEVGAALRWEGR